jgi:hypothetical protein
MVRNEDEAPLTVVIPRYISGFEVTAVGIVLLALFAAMLDPEWMGAPALCAMAAAAVFVIVARPRFILSPEGLTFAVRILFLVTVPYKLIERARIHSITTRWDKETSMHYRANVAAAVRTTYLGVFLEYHDARSGRKLRFTLWRARLPAWWAEGEHDVAEANHVAARYALALRCPLRKL